MPKNMTVTTIRSGLNNKQLQKLIDMYKTTENMSDRVDIDKLERSGFSRKVIKESGYEIETIISIDSC